MKELRKLIRQIINETVSDAGTIFGTYHDEVNISKERTKPQYFSIALNRANKICSDPEISDQGINCPVNYEIKKTKHSAERQFRHINCSIFLPNSFLLSAMWSFSNIRLHLQQNI